MRYRQEYVAIQAATTGMALAAPANAVQGGSSAFSLPAGHVLTEENIHQLLRHKVEFIVVTAPDMRTDDQIAEERARTTERIQTIFSGANLSDPCTASLYEQVMAFRSAG